MTDPTGCSFLSYRRSRAEEAGRLIYALREHGIPTWQDVHDLEFAPTEPEIRRVLDDPSTANAILFITPEVETSAVIRNIEAPLILARHLRNDGFFAVPIAAGGLDYADLPRVLGDGLGHAYISGWNVHRPKTDPLDDVEATAIANAVLLQRLAAIDRAAPAGPLKLEIATRAPSTKQAGAALKIDLAHCFDDRLAKPGAWERILPAFDGIVRAIQKNGRRDVVCSGMLVLPAAVALGASFLAPARINAIWAQDQTKFGLAPAMLGLCVPREPSGLAPETHAYAADGKDLALLISVAEDVTHDFSIARQQLKLSLRAAVSVGRPPGAGATHVPLKSGEATDVAHMAVEALRDAWSTYQLKPDATVHLFLAVPAGVAFMLGQLLNARGSVQTYEHMAGNAQPYHPAARFNPSR